MQPKSGDLTIIKFFTYVEMQIVVIKILKSNNAKELALTDCLLTKGTSHQFS